MKTIPILISRNLQRSIDFYEKLGFKSRLWKGGGYLFLGRDGVELHIREYIWPEDQLNNCSCYIYVPNADVLYTEFKAAGIAGISEISNQAWNMREFSIDDPDHNLLRIGTPLKK